MSDRFDVMFNNVTSNQAPGLNEYEKSVFLTKAQDELVKNYFSPKGNPKQDGFDDSPKRQADFSTIVREGELRPYSGTGFDKRNTTKKFIYPPEVFLVLNEQVYDTNGTSYVVKPISFEEYDRLMCKPYKYPPKYQAWRLITNVLSESTSYIIPGTKTDTISNASGSYVGKTLSVTTNSTIPVTVTVKKLTSETTYTSNEDLFTHHKPVITASSSAISISISIPDNILCMQYYNVCIKNNTELSQYAILGWPDTASIDYNGDWNNMDGVLWNITVVATSETTTDSEAPVVELIGRFNGTIQYSMRFVKKPKPIILVDLTDMGLKISGKSSPSDCELPEQLHEEILQRAVELAKVAWTQTGQDNYQAVIQAGQRSE